MTLSEAKKEIEKRSIELVDKSNNNKGYICPICEAGSGEGETGIISNDNIHFTFIAMNNFDTLFADIYIDYEDKIIFDIDLHYDFLMYISKYNRINDNLIRLVREDWESKYGVL